MIINSRNKKMIICSVVLIQAHYYNWLSDYFRNGPLTSISQSCFFPPLISFLVPQMQILYSHSKKVRRLWFSNDMKWLLFFSLFFLWHYYCIIIIKTRNLYGFLFLSSGEMNDIFVGLMGRRNSEPGECCSWHKSNVLSSPAGIQTERLWCSSHRPYTFMGISCYVLSHREWSLEERVPREERHFFQQVQAEVSASSSSLSTLKHDGHVNTLPVK